MIHGMFSSIRLTGSPGLCPAFFLFLACLLCPLSVVADDSVAGSVDSNCSESASTCTSTDAGMPAAAEIQVDDIDSIFSLLDGTNELLGVGIYGFARRIDEFFADEKLYYESSGSFVRLTVDHVWQQRDDNGFTGNIRVKLNLPRTNEKYKFVIESDPDRLRDELDSDVQSSPVDAADNQDYFAGLQTVIGREDRWRYRAGIGIKVRSPVDSYIRIGARRIYPFTFWSLRLDESMYWFDRDGQSFITAIEFNRSLHDKLLFRAKTQARWAEKQDSIGSSQVFTLYQTLDENRLVSLQAGVYGESEPTLHASNYLVSASFRQNLRQQYLFLELTPQVRYQKINGFVAERGFVLRLEWVFQG